MRDALVAALEARANELSARVVAEMYEDPFWLARFGERGRKFAEEDGRRHLAYLGQALVADDAAVLVEYARWLRPVLTSRGMCTLHLDENLARLARALAAEVPNSEPALALLEQARAGLRYTSGAAGELEAAAPRLIDAAGAEIGGAPRAAAAREIAHIVSYLRDAVALGRPELFGDYVVFAADLARRRGRGTGEHQRALAALGRLIESSPELSPEARALAGDTLARARARLETAPPVNTLRGGDA